MLPDKQRALRELRRVLKPDGLLLVSEELIEPEYVPVGVTRRWCTQAGFQQVAVHRELFFYVLVFRNRHDE
jgi:ubiquinone/menaquinone biosynthesis C-methylase UbiE